ncbi:MAG: hypothetical protein WKG07_02885 [Hymenobacter sp.]
MLKQCSRRAELRAALTEAGFAPLPHRRAGSCATSENGRRES